MEYLYVFLGGGLGSVCRFGINKLMQNIDAAFPYATLMANVTASFFLGMLMAWLAKDALGKPMQFLLMVGFCGGLSTFSTFSGENVYLWQSGGHVQLFTNIVISVALCFAAILAGMRVVG
jgi:CrcB protein